VTGKWSGEEIVTLPQTCGSGWGALVSLCLLFLKMLDFDATK